METLSRDFIKAVMNGDHATAWTLLSEHSKQEVVLASVRHLANKYRALGPGDIEDMRNRYDLDKFLTRSLFFQGFSETDREWLMKLNKAEHSVICLSENAGRVFIDVDGTREIYKISKENGTWKIDFFSTFHVLPLTPE